MLVGVPLLFILSVITLVILVGQTRLCCDALVLLNDYGFLLSASAFLIRFFAVWTSLAAILLDYG